MKEIESFRIIGIAVETTNENGKSAEDLGKLWERFYSDNIPGKIANKISDEVYSIYTDYESDYKGRYISIIGVKVDSIENIPEGLVGREFEGGKYLQFTARGQMPGAVMETWNEIWEKESELNRKYTADFEVYGAKAQNGENSEVDIYIAVK